MNRIEVLRQAALSGYCLSDEFYYLFYKEYEKLPNLSEEERYARSFYTAFSALTPSISEGELIVGKNKVPFTGEAEQEWKTVYLPRAKERCVKAGGGQDSHMTIDYELLLSKGINGVIEMIDDYLSTCDDEKKSFYKCCKICLEAVLKHAESYATLALEMSAQTTDIERKVELLEISRICRRVPANPAETFYEAIQSVHFVTYCLSFNPFKMCTQQFQLGHPDRYLFPFYKRDIEQGRITREYAQLLLDCLGIQINMRVHNGLSSGYMVGGRDEQGDIVANELTDMCMQVIADIRLVYPAVGLCYATGTPEEHLEKACALLTNGHSHPAVFNDEVIMQGLMNYGVPKTQACNYIHSTCVEITPVAASNVWVASPYTNMPQLLLDIMNQEYPSFQALMDAYFEKLDMSIKANYEEVSDIRTARTANSINPLLSCFVNNCLERGLDIERGGAAYNWIMPSFVGMANLVDSLYAIKSIVFDEQRITLCQFKSILDHNFEGNDVLRLQILNHLPKYGNDIDEIDQYFGIIAEHITQQCKKYSGVFTNANLIPSVFCWIMHEYFGRQTSATPDGRKAGFPLGDGSGPCQGREMNGPTASVISSTKWEHTPFIGGVAVNLKFSKSSLGNDSLKTIKTIIKTYLKRGGFEVQINVVDNETLKKAQLNPEEYRDLVVRIGGYSDYFVKLSPEMQEEIILRTAHRV